MSRPKYPNCPCPYCGRLRYTLEDAQAYADKDVAEATPKRNLRLIKSKLKK
jgi:hypothetical protein